MALSSEITALFAKTVVTEEKKKAESKAPAILNGTIVADSGSTYVQIDGSDQLTPVDTTSRIKDGQRVTVMIKNHTAIVTGNLSAPSANQGDLDDLGDKIDEFGNIIADVVTTEHLEAITANIEKLVAEDVIIKGKLETSEAEIKNLTAENVEITGKLEAAEAEIDSLDVEKLDAAIADMKYANIENLNATNANVHNLEVDYGEFKNLTADKFAATNGIIQNLDVKYANIDFSNIGEAAIEKIFADSGIIKDLIVDQGHITGELVGVTIKGDIIEGGTIIADKLVVKGEDGLYYKLNTDGVTTEAEQTEYNSLNGSVITAKSITATKINVEDLVAFDATIGGFNITESSLYSGVKTSPLNATRGVYMDREGQFAVGDVGNYIRYYQDSDGKYKLAISANAIKLGASDLEDLVGDTTVTFTKDGNGSVVIDKNAGKKPIETRIYGRTEQNFFPMLSGTSSYGVTFGVKDNGAVMVAGTPTAAWAHVETTIQGTLKIGKQYTLSCLNSSKIAYAQIELYDSHDSVLGDYIYTSEESSATFTVPTGYSYFKAIINCGDDLTVNREVTLYPMLVESAVIMAEDSKVYYGGGFIPCGLNGISEVNLHMFGKNLMPTAETGIIDGVTVMVADDGGYSVYGTAENNILVRELTQEIRLKPSTTYTLSLTKQPGTQLYAQLDFHCTPNETLRESIFSYDVEDMIKTFTTPDDLVYTNISIRIGAPDSAYPMPIDIEDVKFMLVEGSEVGEYDPPVDPVILPVDLNGNQLCSLPDGTRDELFINRIGIPVITKRIEHDDLTAPLDKEITHTLSKLELPEIFQNGATIVANTTFVTNISVKYWTTSGSEIADAQNTADDAQDIANKAQGSADAAGSKANDNADKILQSEASIEILKNSILNLVTDKNGSSLMTQTSDGWTFNMSSITESIEGANAEIDNLDGRVNSTDEALKITNELVEGVLEKTAYINFNTDENGDPCIELGKKDSSFKVQITNTSVNFMENKNKIAYVSNQNLYIERAIIKTDLQIGEPSGFAWRVRSNGNMGLRWIGN